MIVTHLQRALTTAESKESLRWSCLLFFVLMGQRIVLNEAYQGLYLVASQGDIY